jgi:hypothetical protein
MSEQGRISHLARRAIMALESDCQGERRCLNDVLALLGPEPEEESAHDPVARGVFEAGGLARGAIRRSELQLGRCKSFRIVLQRSK